MFPDSTLLDSFNDFAVDAKLLPKRAQRHRFSDSANLQNLTDSELGFAVAFPMSMAALSVSVIHVLLVCSSE